MYLVSVSRFLLVFLFICLGWCASSQTPNSRIRVPINEKYLEHLIKVGVDSVREAHGLEVLANDSILYVAARHHAEYLGELDRLSHFEMEYDSLKTPQLRGRYFGADSRYLIGENVAKGFHNKVVSSKRSREGNYVGTYAEVAREIVIGWVNSPGHYRNMITPGYEVTGVSIFIHPEDSSVFAVQKFATILYQYQFFENKQFFPYSKYQTKEVTTSFGQVSNEMHGEEHAWGLSGVQDTATYYLTNYVIDQDPRIMKASVSGRSIYFETKGAEYIWKVIQGKNDGLAVEVMTYGPYHCGNPQYYDKPGRRNGQCIFSGQVLEPVYKKKLIRGFKKPRYSKFWKRFRKNLKGKMGLGKAWRAARDYQYHPGYFKLKLGRLPKNVNGLVEFNLVYIKNKEVVRIRHLTDVCGESYSEFEELPFTDSLNTDTLVYSPPRIDSSFVFYFKKGESNYSLKDLYPFLVADFNKYLIDSVSLEAFSSVEGSEKVNLKLQQTRAQAIVNALQERRKLDYDPTITTATNWELFQSQVDSVEELAIFKNKPKELQKKLLDSLLTIPEEYEKLEKSLAFQRYAKIHLQGTYDVQGFLPDFIKYVYEEFEKTLDATKKMNDDYTMMELPDKFHQFQQLMRHYIIKGSLDANYLFEYLPPKRQEYAESWFNLKVFGEEFNNKKFKEMTWSDIYQIYDQEALREPRILQNFFVEQFNQIKDSGGSADPSELKKAAQFLGTHEGWEEMAEIMSLNLNFYVLNTSSEEVAVKTALNEIYNYFMDHKVSPDRIYKVAMVFAYAEDYKRCYELIEPYIDFENPHEGILILYMKLFYQNIQEFPNSNYRQLVFDVKEVVAEKAWCEAFVGPCNISFQVFDDEVIRDAYCETCAKYGNYVTNYVEE